MSGHKCKEGTKVHKELPPCNSVHSFVILCGTGFKMLGRHLNLKVSVKTHFKMTTKSIPTFRCRNCSILFSCNCCFLWHSNPTTMKYNSIILLLLILSVATSYAQQNKNTMKKVSEFRVNIPQSELDDLKGRLKN